MVQACLYVLYVCLADEHSHGSTDDAAAASFCAGDLAAVSKPLSNVLTSQTCSRLASVPVSHPFNDSMPGTAPMTHLVGSMLINTQQRYTHSSTIIAEWRDSFPRLQFFGCSYCGLNGSLGLRGQPQLQTLRLKYNNFSGQALARMFTVCHLVVCSARLRCLP